jgi:hypothetical protein
MRQAEAAAGPTKRDGCEADHEGDPWLANTLARPPSAPAFGGNTVLGIVNLYPTVMRMTIGSE